MALIKNEKLDLAILILISLLLSAYLFFRTYVISMDGAFQYIPMAKIFASGLFKDAIRFSGQQPLYSFLISLVSRLVSDFELAGKLISSFFGILVIFPVYFLGKRIFDQRIAFFSAFFLAIHPYIRRFSADVLKESTYLFFLATAIWFSWKAIQSERRYPYLFIPFFSALAYLIRPDGVEVLLVVFFYILFIKKFSIPGKRWIVILLLLLSSALLFLPYLIHLKETTGVWSLSRAKTISGFLGLGVMGGEVSLINKILFTLKKMNLEIFSRYHPLYILFFIIGLWKRRVSHFQKGEIFLSLFFILHYLALFLLVLNITEWDGKETVRVVQFSGRHVLPLLLFSIYWVGEGFLALYHWIYEKVESNNLLHSLESKRKSTLVLAIFSILVVAIILPKTLKPQRYERLSEKWAGVWVKNQSGKGMTIFTTVHRVPYYAEGNLEYVDFKKDNWDKVEASMVGKGASYLVVQEKDVIDILKEGESIKKNFIEVMRYEEKGMEKIIVYKRVQ
jgi:4-amino-4-deoxy-L-arabinose transferase-like glycosyltransferase